eukprot:g3467.t1
MRIKVVREIVRFLRCDDEESEESESSESGRATFTLKDYAATSLVHGASTVEWIDSNDTETTGKVDPRLIAVGNDNGSVLIWSLFAFDPSDPWRAGTGALKLQISASEHEDIVSAVAVPQTSQGSGANESALLSASWDGVVKLWNISNQGQSVMSSETFIGHSGRVQDVCFSPTNPNVFVSCGDDSRVQWWDRRSSSKETPVGGSRFEDRSFVTCVECDPASGHTLYAGLEDGSIAELDMRGTSSKGTIARRSAHSLGVRRIRASVNGEIASASDDCTVRVLNRKAQASSDVCTYRGHSDYVRALGWDSRGNLLSAGWDRTIQCAYPYRRPS